MMIKFKIARFYAPDMHNEYLERMCVVYYSRVVRFFFWSREMPTPHANAALRHRVASFLTIYRKYIF